MRPACLHHSDITNGEMMHNAHKPIFWRNKISIKDGNKLALRGLHSLLKRPCLESVTIGAVMVADRVSKRCITLHYRVCHLDRFVGRIIEHLDIQLVARILHFADCIYQTIDHELFVEDW